MKDLNVHFVGYFLEKSDKLKLINAINCKDKFFLEAVNNKSLYNKNTAYFPEILYRAKGTNKYNSPCKKINTSLKKSYKLDYQHYMGAKEDKFKFSIVTMAIFMLTYSLTQHKKKNNILLPLNLFNVISDAYKLTKKDNREIPSVKKKLLAYKFRLKFLAGYKYANNLLNKRNYSKNDVYILWGKSYSSRALLVEHLKKHDIPFYIAEYGEIPGTISVSKNGIFGEVFTNESWNNLSQKIIDSKETEYTKFALKKIMQEQISTRNYANNMYFLMKYFYDNTLHTKDKKKIIYVNGAELYSSGLFNNRWNINNKGQNPNKMLLKKVVSHFKDKDYLIMFKEHPMMISQSIEACIKPSDFPTVNFLDNCMNIHDILELANIIISFPSKVVITSLLYQKPTFVLGDFTIRESIPSLAYFTSRNLDDISQLENNTEKYDEKEFVNFVARLIKHTLIVYDEKIHSNYNRKNEETKLNNLLTSDL